MVSLVKLSPTLSLLGHPSDTMQSLHSLHCIGGPVPAEARCGRHKQRYSSSGERLVAGCVPVRVAPGAQHLHGPEREEVLMISSRGGKGLVLPKGGWEDDETVEAAAQRETVEEAGVRGLLEEPMLGTFTFQSAKPELGSVHQGRCVAHMFVMHVVEELGVWPESAERTRTWVPLTEAASRCRHQWMRDALGQYMLRRGWQPPLLPAPTSSMSEAGSARASLDLPGAGAPMSQRQPSVNGAAAPAATGPVQANCAVEQRPPCL